MSKRSSLYIMSAIAAMFCSGAVALQPTVRAGSLSLNAGIKPTASGTAVTPTGTQKTTNNTTTVARGSALSKFSTSVVPVSTGNNSSNNNYSVSSAVLAELQQQINDLRSAQLGLEQNQITRDDIEDTIETQVKNIDITTTNRDLKNALSEIRSTNQGLQTSLNSIQQLADNFTDSLNTDIDNRLKVRGLIDGNNQVSFASKSDIEPTALAQKIVADPTATATLSDRIQPKESDIRDIITDELTDVGVLRNGELDVEKKGQVQITETTVTNALRNSSGFKELVDDAALEKGYIKPNSDTILNLATKAEVEPVAIAAKIADNPTATAALSGKIGTNMAEVKTLLRTKNLLDDNDNTKAITTDDLDTTKVITTSNLPDKLSESNVITTDNVNNAYVKTALSNAGFAQVSDLPEVTITDDMIATALGNTNTLDNAVVKNLKEKQILDSDGTTLKVATKDDVTVESLGEKLKNTFAAKDAVGTDETAVQNLIFTGLKSRGIVDDEDTLNVATKKEIQGLATNSSVETLRSNLTTATGDINVSGSILNQIATDSDLKELLKGNPGTSVSAADVKTDIISTLTKDPDFIEKTKGPAGSGYNFKGDVSTDEELNAKPKVQGHAYYHKTKQLLYICGCDDNGTNCQWYGEPFKGETGASAWYAYCETGDNLTNIIKPLYGSDKTCDNFSLEDYNALMGGAGTYCLYIAQNATTLFASDDANTPLARKLKSVLKDDNIISRLRADGISASVNGSSNQSSKFVLQCRQKYNDIMNPDTVEYTYCKDNFNIVKALYSDTDEDCSNFTSDRYTAIMGGARAYCLSLATNAATLDLSTGIGKKLSNTFTLEKMNSFKSASNVASRLSLSGFKLNSTGSETGTFIDACEVRYNEIMAGNEGKSAARIWCEAHVVADGFRTTATVKKMSAAKTLNAFVARNNSIAGLQKSGNEGYFTSITECLAAVEADPSLMGGETAEEAKYNADVASGDVTFDISTDGRSIFNQRKANFIASIKGAPGTPGAAGANGKTYKPTLTADGDISWTVLTDGSAPSIAAMNIRGPRGLQGIQGINGINGRNGTNGKTFRPVLNNGTLTFTESNDTSAASINFVDGIRAALVTNGTSSAAAGTASLEDAIAAIAARVAFDVSKSVSKEVSKEVARDISTKVSDKVSRHVSKQVSTNVSNSVSNLVARDRINDIKGTFMTPAGFNSLISTTNSGGKTMTSLNIDNLRSCDENMCSTNTTALNNLSAANTVLSFTENPTPKTVNDSDAFANVNVSSLSSEIDNVALDSNISSKIDAAISTSLGNDVFQIAGITRNTSVSCSTSQYLSNGICMSCGEGATSTGGSASSCSCGNGFTWTTSGCACSGDDKYISNGICTSLPANATRTTDGFICDAGYYKNTTGTACNTCGEGATSESGSTSCTCNDAEYNWTSTSNGGQCILDATQARANCIADTSTYWNGTGCENVPTNADQTSGGEGFTCHANYYKSGASCLSCGNGTSPAGSTSSSSCSCNSGALLTNGTCQTCNGSIINNECIDDSAKCAKKATESGQNYVWANGQCTIQEDKCYDNTVLIGNACKPCEEMGATYNPETQSCKCNSENQYFNNGTESPGCRACPEETHYEKGACVCDNGGILNTTKGSCEK